MNKVSYSQNLEDIVLYKALFDVENGKYVDVGAGHPEEMSVTKLFYDLGWSGINIEPNSAFFNELENQRPRDLNMRVLVSDKSETLAYFSIPGGLSTADQNLSQLYEATGAPQVIEFMKTQRLDQILKEAYIKEEIHFLKIDVEGMELNVLQSMDFERFKPWIVVIESIDPITKLQVTADCSSHLIDSGYVLAYEDGLNQFYLSNSKLDLNNRFRFPPNIQDNFVRKNEVNLYELLNTQKNISAELKLQNRALEIQIDSQSELLKTEQAVKTELQRKVESYEKLNDRYKTSSSTYSLQQHLENEIENLKKQIHNLHSENHAIKNSTIWMYTKSLRAILAKWRVMWNRSHRLISNFSLEFLLNTLKMNIGRRFPIFRRFLKESDSHLSRIFRTILKIEKKCEREDGHLDSIFVMGEKVITQQEWNELIKNHVSKDLSIEDLDLTMQSKISEKQQDPSTTVYSAAVIISLYKSDEYLPALLINILEQTAFSDCEICILSVEPSVSEIEILSRFSSTFTNVKLQFSKERIGIYNAWNQMIRTSTAPYITNMNADDLRSHNSIQLQIDYLNRNEWVDVVYQDFFYAREHGVDWDILSKIDAHSNLPTVSLYSLVARGINPPHNAPMWRRSVHDSVGYFLETLKSAGDIEFWIRCKLKGIVFLKMREIHVSYFLNPNGMSTSVDTPGRSESTEIILKGIEVFNDALGIKGNEINLLDPFFCVQTQASLRKKLKYDLATIGNHDDN